jgi:hypothetical protein
MPSCLVKLVQVFHQTSSPNPRDALPRDEKHPRFFTTPLLRAQVRAPITRGTRRAYTLSAAKIASLNDTTNHKGYLMLGLILLIVLIMLLVGATPVFPYSRNWGYGPSGGLGLLLIVVLVLVLMRAI